MEEIYYKTSFLNQKYLRVGRKIQTRKRNRDDDDVIWPSAASWNKMIDRKGFRADSGLLPSIVESKSITEFSYADSVRNDGTISTNNLMDKSERLFEQFCEIVQMGSRDVDVVNVVQKMAQACAYVVEESKRKEIDFYGQNHVKSGVVHMLMKDIKWLELEMKVWKLIHVLYYDRIIREPSAVEEEVEYKCSSLHGMKASEYVIVQQLFASNAELREYQLIVEWLEDNYENKERTSMISRLPGKNAGWWNTALVLKGVKNVAFCGSGRLVSNIDMDAPLREGRCFHPLDEEDDKLLSQIVFHDIRSGRLDESCVLLQRNDQYLKCALYQGWQLYDDPNYREENADNKTRLPVHGNPRRDLWKHSTWRVVDRGELDEYHRANLGSLCGHFGSMKGLLRNWDDFLWAYLKVQIDMRVETEIRLRIPKHYVGMPHDYWAQRMSLDIIFQELDAHSYAEVRDYANSYIGFVLKCIIMDDKDALLNQISLWIEDGISSPTTDLTPHHLRFFTHIILFLRQINAIENEDLAEKVISAYVDVLITKGDAHLVAYYAAYLTPQIQIDLYSKFLEPINDKTARSDALDEAINMELHVEPILKATVERARQREPACYATEQMQVGRISYFDENKIKSLEWLTFLPTLELELIWQSNAMIRYYLAEQKTDCVKAVLKQIPPDCINSIITKYGGKECLPAIEQFAIKEYLCYEVYIEGLKLFNEWYELHQQRPEAPKTSPIPKDFSAKVAMHQERATYPQKLRKWTKAFDEQTTATRDALFKIILFPDDGWLADPQTIYSPVGLSTSDLESRSAQLQRVRSICIPEVVFLLQKMLMTCKDQEGCMQLANIIASEMNCLYTNIPPEKIAELLHKLAETSIGFLKENLDPWGFPKNT